HHPGEHSFLILRGHAPALARQQPERSLAVAALQGPDPPVLRGRGSWRARPRRTAPRRRKGGHQCEGYFFATLEDNSSSITCLNDSKGMAPTSRLPLMKKVGVPFAPTALPALMSAWIRACPLCDSTDAFHFAT